MKTLRHQPWLKPVNLFNIHNRIQEETHGDMVVVFNMLTGNYEIHSEYSYDGNLQSSNGMIPDEYLNGYLIKDIRATNLRANEELFREQRREQEHMWDQHEEFVQKYNVSSKLRAVERGLGRRL